MIKTLKITSIIAAIICAVLVVLIVGFGLKGDPKIEKFLASPSIIQELKKVLGKTPAESDLVSPLVKEARAFALRIDPPPPPVAKPLPPRTPAGQAQVTKKPAIPQPKAPIAPSGKFELIATCRYEEDPRKSLALINLPAKGNQWFRVGENVEHLVIDEINDGSIVFTQNGGNQSSVLMKQIPTKIRSLLASDAGIGTTQTGAFGPASTIETDNRSPLPAGYNTSPTAPSQPSGTTATRQPRTYIPQTTSRTRRIPPQPTAQQRKEALDKNIVDLKQIMKDPSPSASKEDAKKEQESLAKLLELLQKERQETENAPKEDIEKSENKNVTE